MLKSLMLLFERFPPIVVLVLCIGALLLVLFANMYNSAEKSKKRTEANTWENSETGKEFLNTTKDFESMINQVETQFPPCTKCNGQKFQFWDIAESFMTFRCIDCKKKVKHTITDNTIPIVLGLYTNYVITAYSHENEFIANKMIAHIKYDFVGLRKGTPLMRAIVFDANGTSESINDVKTDDKDSRRISQTVKDKVWNRDGGKCVECGSNKLLEFDHIIPHSKGGSNTYRNIQLLCESCNRKKSDKIG